VNMFIFITPHIIKNPADIAGVTLDKEERLSVALPQVKEELHREPNPEHSVALADRGFDMLKSGDTQAAKEYFLKSLYYDDSNPYALINLGVTMEKEGNYDQAIELYNRVIETITAEAAKSLDGLTSRDLPLLDTARQNINNAEQLKRKNK